MEREKVLEILNRYAMYCARREYLLCRHDELLAMRNDLKRSAVEDAVHITQGYGSGGGSGRISNPTERLAIMFASGEVPDTVRDVEAAAEECEDEIREIVPVIRSVDAWMKCLSDRERLVVEYKEVRGETWTEVLKRYEATFPGEIFSKRALRCKRDQAITRICDVAM